MGPAGAWSTRQSRLAKRTADRLQPGVRTGLVASRRTALGDVVVQFESVEASHPIVADHAVDRQIAVVPHRHQLP
ncbi:hypothetical protein [Halorhabdus rudnickae]|uniref:hypothetical protein n=1 Tax=Halorhabdus rudnickae TaxID=1775544 RepID=UPI0010831081|nr:hypothetical protein [Halorhabdus rudnickae]